MNRYRLEELPSLVGQELGVSEWFLIDQDRIDRFAQVTEDRQWIHVDRERAGREIGGTIAHGFLTLSLMSAMAETVMALDGVLNGLNYGFDRVRFTGPVRSGSRVRLRLKLNAADASPDGMQLRYGCTVEVEGSEKPALVADWLARFQA